MDWKIVKGRKPCTWRLLTTDTDPDHRQPAGWGLSAWHAHGAVRNSASSRVAVHSGDHWPMDWKFEQIGSVAPSASDSGSGSDSESGPAIPEDKPDDGDDETD